MIAMMPCQKREDTRRRYPVPDGDNPFTDIRGVGIGMPVCMPKVIRVSTKPS